MDESRQGDQVAAETLVQPKATRKHLNRGWIGIGLALDWIAMRGQPMPVQDFYARHDEAASALVDLLADMPPEIAESLVQGVPDEDQGKSEPIPSGIWRQTAANVYNEASRPYRLIGVDDDDENEGAILRPHLSGYRKVQIRAYFIADSWPETTLAIVAVKSRPAVSVDNIEKAIQKIRAEALQEIGLLANGEITKLVRRLMPHASRGMVRDLVNEAQPDPKRGPKGPRQPGRKDQLEEFGRRLLAAKLQK
jgi:hypothetical protein